MHKIICMDRLELGRQIALMRKEKGWDQIELGRRAGVSRAFISNLERGTGSDPGIQKILNILALFSCTLKIIQENEPPTLDDLLQEQDL
ncbi:MAG: helix-turn-helix transcriptional regulator [Desulfohalobiaceae bacterium]